MTVAGAAFEGGQIKLYWVKKGHPHSPAQAEVYALLTTAKIVVNMCWSSVIFISDV